jgi:hypothetical protein
MRLGLMVALRSRRLEALFRSDLDAISADAVRGLVQVSAEEAFDLDFKRGLYGRGDAEKRDLAVDVAALANTAGGMIVLGIAEDEHARASATPGVEVTDAEIARMQQIVASIVSPMPMFDVLRVLDDGANAESQGFILVAVPRSPSAPHAVLVGNSLRYPRRNGSTTRYLSEPEVAAAYRERDRGATQQSDRIAQVEQAAQDRLDRSRDAWLLVSLAPELPGSVAISSCTFEQFRGRTVGRNIAIMPIGWGFGRASVGRRRFLADATRDNAPHAQQVTLELHSDGAGVFGLQLGDIGLGVEPPRPNQTISDEAIVITVLSGLLRLGQHARDDAAAGGNALARAILLPSDGRPVEIGQVRTGFPESMSRVAIGDERVVAEASAPLEELATPGTAVVATAAMLVNELGQSFGITEFGHMSSVGEIRRRYWSSTFNQQMLSWAEQHRIAVTESLIGDV